MSTPSVSLLLCGGGTPGLRELNVSSCALPSLDAVFAHPWLRRLVARSIVCGELPQNVTSSSVEEMELEIIGIHSTAAPSLPCFIASKCSRLNSLVLSGTNVDLSHLDAPALEHLRFETDSICVLDLSRCRQLRSMVVGKRVVLNHTGGFGGLSSLRDLRCLTVEAAETPTLTDFADLASCVSLETIVVHAAKGLTSLQGLAGLPNLTRVEITSAPRLRMLADFSNSRCLRGLYVPGNRALTQGALAELGCIPSLQELDLTGAPSIHTISCLVRSCAGLIVLGLSDCSVTSSGLLGVRDLSRLEVLLIDRCAGVDGNVVDELMACKRLRRLSARGTQLSEVNCFALRRHVVDVRLPRLPAFCHVCFL